MLDKIIQFSIKNKFIILLFTLVLIAFGSYSIKQLPLDALPDVTNNQVQIITTAPTLASQEVEQLITYPLEQSFKTIPKVIELRSISRFGLSVVTVVFKDDVDIYWAREQIFQRLSQAKENIPAYAGSPELAPISTGLGEIYQYDVYAKKGYEDKYDAVKLRTIQDWIIIPQLQGIEGVAEVSTWGGKLKQYEIAVNPNTLNSLGVTITEIFEALEKNNQNTGGAYIEKDQYAYFIRGVGMATGIKDLENVVVKNRNGARQPISGHTFAKNKPNGMPATTAMAKAPVTLPIAAPRRSKGITSAIMVCTIASIKPPNAPASTRANIRK